ncbi:hypothetical protein [Bacillus mycoides]|uniref:hypothetical protein n=1 Tax=Bacillus mycoides TaxID=1405 RepID=UPI003A80906A
MFKIKDSNGMVYNRVKNPAALYDAELSVLHKVGESEFIASEYTRMVGMYRNAGLHEEADALQTLDLPHDQNEIDKVFQICDYIGVLHRKHKLN